MPRGAGGFDHRSWARSRRRAEQHARLLRTSVTYSASVRLEEPPATRSPERTSWVLGNGRAAQRCHDLADGWIPERRQLRSDRLRLLLGAMEEPGELGVPVLSAIASCSRRRSSASRATSALVVSVIMPITLARCSDGRS